jgi:hypothetical protein
MPLHGAFEGLHGADQGLDTAKEGLNGAEAGLNRTEEGLDGLLQTGALELKWKCNNPSGTQGTIYEVKRQIGGVGSGGFVFVGASGVRSFTDDTLPSGSAPVTYQITAVRSTARGKPAQFTVNFGIGGGGGFAITSITGASEGTSVKMAA